MCQFGMTTTLNGQVGLVRKPTTFLTNSPEVAKRLDQRCSMSCRGRTQHIAIQGSRARLAQQYPVGLCRAVAEGVKAEKMIQTSNLSEINAIEVMSLPESIELLNSQAWKDTVHDDNDTEWLRAWDDQTGCELNPQEVMKARRLEMKYVKQMGVYAPAPVSEAWDVTGKAPIKSRWLDINKGDDENINYRSRWVAKQFKTHEEFELFAATPPLDAVRFVISKAASMTGGRLMANDVSRAYFYAPATRKLYVDLPDEAEEGRNVCARLLKSLYGTRDAATNWSQAYTSVLHKMGFVTGVSNPCLFYCESKDISTVVHGDDFLSSGTDSSLDWMRTEMAKHLEIKTQRIGPKTPERSLTFLGRVVSWESGGIRYEADPRHHELVIAGLGLKNGKPAVTPGVSGQCDIRDEKDDTNPLLKGVDATAYRAISARLNFLAQDRADLQYSVKEASRWMSAPRTQDWEVLRRIGRYLLYKPRSTVFYKWQKQPNELTIFTDTDWAGCKTTRRSTSGGVILHGDHMIKSYSKMQNLVSLSSAEAELYGVVRASSEALGCQSLARDLGCTRSIRVYADASAALGIVHRKGLGKVRHLDTSTLWVQQAAYSKKISYDKVLGTLNPADMMTKHLAEPLRKTHVARIFNEWIEGRAGQAPKLCEGAAQSLEG